MVKYYSSHPARMADGTLFWSRWHGDSCVGIPESYEHSVTDWDPTATSDLEALRSVFNTNGDGVLNASDTTWSQFRVARTEPDGTLSYHTLDALGITEIDLMGDATNIELPDGSVITGQTTFTMNGQTRTVGEMTLATDGRGYRLEELSLPNNAEGVVSMKEEKKTILGARLTILVCLLLGGLFAEPGNAQESTVLEDISDVLSDMGFRDVRTEGCLLSFSRDVVPGAENRGTQEYERLINLRSLEIEQASEISQGYDGRGFVFSIPYTEDYGRSLRQMYSFDSWARSEFPEANWPVNHPGDFDDYSESISEQFLEWNSFSQTASRYTFFSELGVIVVVERGFYMSHFDESLLSLFRIELTLLTHSNNCMSNGD